MNVAYNIGLRRAIVQLAAVAVFLLPLSAIAGGQRPATQRLLLDGEEFTALSVTYDGVAQGGVAAAQSDVPAAIYRSTGCGFQQWIAGQPVRLDQMCAHEQHGI